MGGHSAAAQAPTPPAGPENLEAEVENCLDEVIKLVMKRHYRKDLISARKKEKRKAKKEREKMKKSG